MSAAAMPTKRASIWGLWQLRGSINERAKTRTDRRRHHDRLVRRVEENLFTAPEELCGATGVRGGGGLGETPSVTGNA
jgi:hypothetical protein